MNKQQENLLTEAKLVMLRRMPYYGTFVIGVPLLPDDGIPTACTNFTEIKFNPNWLLGGHDDVPLRHRDEVVFVLGHEVLHMSFKHGIRMGFREPKLWNVACDYAINLILHDGEVGRMPEPDTKKGDVKLLDERFRNMSAEAIYDILEKQNKKQNGGKSGGKLKINGVIIDLSKDDPGGTGGFEKPVNPDGSELSEAQKADLERDIDAKTSASAQAAKMQGKLPSGLERFIKAAMAPEVDWRERLRMFVSKQFPSDYSWSRPNRRHLWQDLYLPHVEKTGVGEILTIMDTSGSVEYSHPKSEGAQYYAEIKAIFDDVCPSKMHVMYCDAEVAGYDVFDQGEEPYLKPRGGGGTDFRPPFTKVEQEGLQIQCAIYLTDGYGSFPDKPPPYPVLWVCTTDVVAPWGETIRIMKHQ